LNSHGTQRTPSPAELVRDIRALLSVVACGNTAQGGRARDRVNLMLDILQELAEPKAGAHVDTTPIRWQWRQIQHSGEPTEWVDCSAEFYHRLQGRRIERRTLGVIQEPKP
jgi:hypothetical protein